jgi:predicted ester cyclase
MSAIQEANKATFRRLLNTANSGDVEIITTTIDDLLEPDAVFHAALPPGVTAAQAMKQIWTVLLRAFPDLQVTVEDVLAVDDKIVARNTVTGTHQGEYLGLAPTGRTVTYAEIFIARFEAGRVAEIWGVVDGLAQRRQLGLIPA